MVDTTTIQITAEQRAELAARKTYDDEPMKAVIGRLLESRDTLLDDEDLIAEQIADRVRQHSDPGDGADAERIAREVARQLDYTAIASQVSDDVMEALR